MSEKYFEQVLNHLRRHHLPSYVAARLAERSVLGKSDNCFAEAISLSSFRSGPDYRAYQFKQFKSVEVDGTYCYRDMTTLAPSTALAETIAIERLYRLIDFNKSARVYSYRIPKRTDSAWTFEYYIYGYHQRNADISDLLTRDSSLSAITIDLAKFYPSISKNSLRASFASRLLSSNPSPKDKLILEHLVQETFDVIHGPDGVPIGPQLSAALADLALAELDAVCQERYSEHYFRYVDDIVVVCPTDKADQTLDELKQLIPPGLTINEDKTDIVSAARWNAVGPKGIDKVENLSFEALVFRLKAFLARRPSEIDGLRVALSERGINIPLARLEAIAASTAFVQFFRLLREVGWRRAREASRDTPEILAEFGVRVKQAISEKLKEAAQTVYSDTICEQKWRSQRLRRFANQYLYFADQSELSEIEQLMAGVDDAHQTRTVARALRLQDVREILQMPGPSIAAFASIAQEQDRKVSLPLSPSDACKESAATLLLYNCVSNPVEYISSLSGKDQLYAKFCAGVLPSSRELADFSYIDELRCLQLGAAKSPQQLVNSRYSEREIPQFEALGLGMSS